MKVNPESGNGLCLIDEGPGPRGGAGSGLIQPDSRSSSSPWSLFSFALFCCTCIHRQKQGNTNKTGNTGIIMLEASTASLHSECRWNQSSADNSDGKDQRGSVFVCQCAETATPSLLFSSLFSSYTTMLLQTAPSLTTPLFRCSLLPCFPENGLSILLLVLKPIVLSGTDCKSQTEVYQLIEKRKTNIGGERKTAQFISYDVSPFLFHLFCYF